MYDYIIVGAGPSGLTLAYTLGVQGKKCLLVDKNDSIGGCHRVKRINGLFTEHGPRIYLDGYVNTISLFKKMGFKFEDIFVDYNFNISSVDGQSISNFSFKEIMLFLFEFLKLLVGIENSKNISIGKFMKNNNFSYKAKDYVDRLCRLTDGAGKERYTLYQFLQLINQHVFYKIYQPKKPNDKLLLPLIQKAIEETNKVDIILNRNVLKVNGYEDIVTSILLDDGKVIEGNKIILAIPPYPLHNLLKDSGEKVYNSFVPQFFLNIIERNSYNNYLPIMFHWNKKIDLNKIWGFPASEWGIAFIVLTDYMNFEDSRSQTVISTCVTFSDRKSSFNKKTAHQCNKQELINEVFRQLKISYPDLPKPTHSILNPSVKRVNEKWIETDTGYVATQFNEKINSKSKNIRNLYNVGTHNGNTKYHFTSFESAVTNALTLLHDIEPSTQSKYKIKSPNSLVWFIRLIILLLLLLWITLK